MKKIYKYSSEEEKRIDIRKGYTQEQLSHVSWNKQHQFQIGIPEIKHFFELRKIKFCSRCGKPLVWAKELIYVGISPHVGSTGGDYEKAYEMHLCRYCSNCNKLYR